VLHQLKASCRYLETHQELLLLGHWHVFGLHLFGLVLVAALIGCILGNIATLQGVAKAVERWQ